jgi:predicted flavoprotein YhiN
MKELNFEQMAALEGGQCVDMMAMSLEDLLFCAEIVDGHVDLGGYGPCTFSWRL